MGLTEEDLYDAAVEVAESLPGAEVYPFTEDWEAARVAGKWFLITSMHRGRRIINLKAHPDDVQALQQAYAEITPGYHMNKKHWFTVHAGPTIDAGFLRELITESYLTVVAKLPAARRPLGWQAFDPLQGMWD